MPKAKQQKEAIVSALEETLKGAKSAVIATIDGLSVAASEELRNKMRKEEVKLVAVKKTLLKRVLTNVGWTEINETDLSGSLALAVSQKDEVTPAKLFKDFAKTHDKVQFRAGVVEGKILNLSELQELASLPSKQELLAKVVGSLQAPISGFVNVLAGNLRGLVTVLDAIKNNKA